MADDENNADLDNADSATGLAACLASEEDESREVARAPRPRGVRAAKSDASGIVLHVHESNEEDGNSEDKDDDVADDLEAECLDRNSNPLSQRKQPRDRDQEAANVLPDTRPDSVVVVRNRTRADSCGEGSCVAELVSIDRVPRHRRSETWGQRIGIIKSVEHVSNLLPHFPLWESNDWDSVLEAEKSYTEDNHLRYRWRDSRLTETHNK
ncbi:hypothetical protein GN244_ATG00597 [Phytophthora infestans]|uniref:Uncharacterized protein n=1 Tax=Phytophthora infestans TaxID=4787 RepID=A0A833TMS8_PHYIN|nr:hypothetical protein GN244_ATG00597 [Phytophthora infestans]KAF4127251.1 hypothetical protein GN958_ATG23565 [Phytophthora infestans]